MTAPEADVVVVGSGPAGVSAAWPLAEAGLRVILLDASEPGADTGLAPAVHRADPDHWKTRFGRRPRGRRTAAGPVAEIRHAACARARWPIPPASGSRPTASSPPAPSDKAASRRSGGRSR